MVDKKIFRQIVKQAGETMGNAAAVMGLERTSLYRKLNGETDFYTREVEAFCKHYKANPLKVFFKGFTE